MNALGAQLPTLVALAAHAAICVTGVSLTGAAALWICRRRSAPLRHALALAFLASTLLVPAIAALYQYRLIRFNFASPPRQTATSAVAARPNVGPAGALIEEPAMTGKGLDNGPHWSFIACAVFAMVWAGGCTVGCVRMLLVNRRQRQYLASLWPVADADALSQVARLRVALGIRRGVDLLSSREAPWPFTVGLFHPRVVVPGELLQPGSRSRLEAVLLHELAHVRRLDCGIAAVEELARLVYWWNPLVAALMSHLAAAREEICDGYVLAHMGDGASLARYLLSSAEKASHVQLRFAVGLSWHDPLSLKRRITQLLAGDRNTMVRISSLATAAVVVSALIVSFFFTHANYASASLVVGMPINLGPVVNSAPWPDGDPELSADGLTLYFSTSRDTSGRRIAVSQRTTTNSPWTTPTIVPELNGTGANPWFRTSPTVTDDQLLMFFYASATVTVTNWDLYQSSRESVSAPWGRPVTVGAPVNSPFNDQIPGISGDGLTLYFSSDRQGTGGLDIYMAQRTTRSEPFGAPIRLGDEINSSGIDGGVDISSDGLLLVFHSTREPPEAQIFYSERASTSDPWSPAKRLTIGDETLVSRGNPSLSADQAQLYFTGRTGDGDVNTADLYVADIVPEPSTAALILAGCFVCALSTLLVLRKRQV